MLLLHFVAKACARALPRLGSRIEINRAMIPMTTSSSTKVKPRRITPARGDERFNIRALRDEVKAAKQGSCGVHTPDVITERPVAGCSFRQYILSLGRKTTFRFVK